MSALVGYQYVVLRCVPRVDREEFINVGVVLYAQMADFLAARSRVDDDRLRALAPEIDPDAVRAHLSAIEAVCAGDPSAGDAGTKPLLTRFGFVSAPRSTVVQPGPIHGGLTADPASELERLLATLVG